MAFQKLSLYELTQEGLQIQDLLIENAGELTPEIEDRLDYLLSQGADAIEAAAMVTRGMEASAVACREEGKRLTDRARAIEDQCEGLKSRMVFALDSVFHGRVKTSLFTIWAQSSAPTLQFELKPGTTLEQLYIQNPEAVRVKMELNKLFLAEHRHEIPEALEATEVEGKRFCRIK